MSHQSRDISRCQRGARSRAHDSGKLAQVERGIQPPPYPLDKTPEPKHLSFFLKLAPPMPLTRGKILGFDASRMTYKFTMADGPRIIDCQISSAALDDLAGQRSKPPRVLNRDAQFLEFRDQIEKLASDQFDRDIERKPKLVRVFAKHIPKGDPGT
jgi:hypothetical protein